MKTLKKNAANLLKVKTIVTLLLTVVFCILALTGVVSGKDFLTVFTVVIAFYLGTQSEKSAAVAYTAPIGAVTDSGAMDMEADEDSTMANEVHPPDRGAAQDITVTGFAG